AYLLESPKTKSFHRRMYLDTAADVVLAVSSKIIVPDAGIFGDDIVSLRYGLTDSPGDKAEFRARIHEETALNNARKKAFKVYEIPGLRDLGSGKDANLSVSFSGICTDIIPGREVL